MRVAQMLAFIPDLSSSICLLDLSPDLLVLPPTCIPSSSDVPQDMVTHPMMFIDGTTVPDDLGSVPSTRARRSGGGGGALSGGGDTSGGGAAVPSGGAEPSAKGGRSDRSHNEDEGESSESGAEDAAATGADGADDGGRPGGRSRRVGKARVVYVNGHPVLKENM